MTKPHLSNPRARCEIRQRQAAIRRAELQAERATRRPRLTDVERAERALGERDFARQVTDLAELLGWTWCHWRALRNGHGIWQVPVEGPLGTGWPDLTLLRIRDRRLVFAELKRELEQPSPAQLGVLDVLRALEPDRTAFLEKYPDGHYRNGGTQPMCRVDVAVWRPSDLRDPIESSRIYGVLR